MRKVNKIVIKLKKMSKNCNESEQWGQNRTCNNIRVVSNNFRIDDFLNYHSSLIIHHRLIQRSPKKSWWWRGNSTVPDIPTTTHVYHCDVNTRGHSRPTRDLKVCERKEAKKKKKYTLKRQSRVAHEQNTYMRVDRQSRKTTVCDGRPYRRDRDENTYGLNAPHKTTETRRPTSFHCCRYDSTHAHAHAAFSFLTARPRARKRLLPGFRISLPHPIDYFFVLAGMCNNRDRTSRRYFMTP